MEKQELVALLEQHEIPLNEWGIAPNKGVGDLLVELNTGQCQLMEFLDDLVLVRQVCLVVIRPASLRSLLKTDSSGKDYSLSVNVPFRQDCNAFVRQQVKKQVDLDLEPKGAGFDLVYESRMSFAYIGLQELCISKKVRCDVPMSLVAQDYSFNGKKWSWRKN